MNLLLAKCQKDKNRSSQIEISAGYGKSTREDKNPALQSSPYNTRKSLKPIKVKKVENTSLIMPERKGEHQNENARSKSVIPALKYSL